MGKRMFAALAASSVFSLSTATDAAPVPKTAKMSINDAHAIAKAVFLNQAGLRIRADLMSNQGEYFLRYTSDVKYQRTPGTASLVVEDGGNQSRPFIGEVQLKISGNEYADLPTAEREQITLLRELSYQTFMLIKYGLKSGIAPFTINDTTATFNANSKPFMQAACQIALDYRESVNQQLAMTGGQRLPYSTRTALDTPTPVLNEKERKVETMAIAIERELSTQYDSSCRGFTGVPTPWKVSP